MAVREQTRPMTIAEFMDLPDDGNLHELVRGELRVMPPPKGVHGRIETAIVEAVARYLYDKAISLGWDPRAGITGRDELVGFVAGGEFGIQFDLPDDPNQVRGVDAAYVPAEQLAAVSGDRTEYFPGVPRLVIEVVSPTDRAGKVMEKVRDCLDGGARRVWCLYPEQRAVFIHHADGSSHVARGDDATLADEELLPGFDVPLTMVFSGD